MEVLVLIDFEGTMGDEITMRAGDVIKNVTKAGEEGWLEGELREKRGIFPANFVKEVPVYLTGNSKREPRSIRKSIMLSLNS
ncbi:CD2-associated protein-like [Trachinotus anak]|uniref:CD2-associated protein-like n=1 Tax=Trachinotus anak TaxID=443729 RepID=UPI0039F19207